MRPSASRSGWIVVGVCFGALSVSFAARSLLGLSMTYMSRDLHWSVGLLSNGASYTLVVMAIVSPIAGNMIDRFGARVLLVTGLLAVALGMGLTAAARQPWQFELAFGLVSGIGFGMVATHAVATIVSLTFEQNRGLAVGVANAGATGGQLMVVPIIAAFLIHASWRWSFWGLALAAAAMAALVPALVPGRHANLAHARRQGDERAKTSILVEVDRLLRLPVFHLLFWSYAICGFTTSGIVEVHLLPYAATCGFPPLESAVAYGVLSAFNLLGMILAGWLTDRINRPLLLGLIYILRGVSFLVLIWAAHDISLLFLFAVIFGLFDYSTGPVVASLVASHIGLRTMGLTMGLLSAGHALGAAGGVFLGGLFFDLFARYLWLWVAAVGLAFLAGGLCFAITENRGLRRPVAMSVAH
jgi:MFS family permease